jgi:hypothetical protein
MPSRSLRSSTTCRSSPLRLILKNGWPSGVTPSAPRPSRSLRGRRGDAAPLWKPGKARGPPRVSGVSGGGFGTQRFVPVGRPARWSMRARRSARCRIHRPSCCKAAALRGSTACAVSLSLDRPTGLRPRGRASRQRRIVRPQANREPALPGSAAVVRPDEEVAVTREEARHECPVRLGFRGSPHEHMFALAPDGSARDELVHRIPVIEHCALRSGFATRPAASGRSSPPGRS